MIIGDPQRLYELATFGVDLALTMFYAFDLRY